MVGWPDGLLVRREERSNVLFDVSSHQETKLRSMGLTLRGCVCLLSILGQIQASREGSEPTNRPGFKPNSINTGRLAWKLVAFFNTYTLPIFLSTVNVSSACQIPVWFKSPSDPVPLNYPIMSY